MLLDRQEQLPTKKTMQKLRELTRSVGVIEALRKQARGGGGSKPPPEALNVYGITFERERTREISSTSGMLKRTVIGSEESRPASPAKASYTP